MPIKIIVCDQPSHSVFLIACSKFPCERAALALSTSRQRSTLIVLRV